LSNRRPAKRYGDASLRPFSKLLSTRSSGRTNSVTVNVIVVKKLQTPQEAMIISVTILSLYKAIQG
jgi:hypothetical protein